MLLIFLNKIEEVMIMLGEVINMYRQYSTTIFPPFSCVNVYVTIYNAFGMVDWVGRQAKSLPNGHVIIRILQSQPTT